MRQAPSMTGLRMLEAVLRVGSLSAAARELCVTPAAVSHRLRDLEAHCGTALVSRAAGRFEATATGRAILDALGDAFQRIRAADALMQAGKDRPLQITASYSFAVLWLAPRIAGFQARHAEIELSLHPAHDPLAQGQAAVKIVHSARRPEPGDWAPLFEDRCAAMARADHPFFAEDGAGPQSVLRGRLVHIAHDNGPDSGEFSWQRWADRLGLDGPLPLKGSTVSAEHMAVDLLLAGDAFALISTINASRLLADGRLRAVPGSEVATGCTYWISSGTGSRSRPVSDFLHWITGELGA